MARSKTVPFVQCGCGKRGFEDEYDAEKALGKARTKRNRSVEGECRRGIKRESRYYYCHVGDCFHLTEQSRRTYNGYATDAEIEHVQRTVDLRSLIPTQAVTLKQAVAA